MYIALFTLSEVMSRWPISACLTLEERAACLLVLAAARLGPGTSVASTQQVHTRPRIVCCHRIG